MIIYRGTYTDQAADPVTNELTAQVKRLDITDTESNPYDIQYFGTPVGPNTLFTFVFNPLPATATSTAIVWSDDAGVTWNTVAGTIANPQTITLPTGPAYIFQFIVYFSAGGPITWNSEDTIITLEMTDDPVRVIVIDNSEDKFTPIRAKQLAIQIFSSNDISINTFADGGDNRFKAEWYIEDVLHFVGWLSLGDLRQEFLPDPNIINLTAVDGLGFLSDIPLTDRDGMVPQNEQLLLDFLLWALYQTGHQLNLKMCFNIREETVSNLNDDDDGLGHFMRSQFVDTKTFEDNVGTCINCYDVITRILGNECFLSQHLGEWVIMRVDEMEHGLASNTFYKWRFDGEFIEKTTELFSQSVGIGSEHSWMDERQEVSIERLNKEVQLDYKYDLPQEIICNIDFERGDFVADLADVTEDAGEPGEITYQVKSYDLDCWEKNRENFPTSGLISATVPINIIRYFVNDYERRRFVVIPHAAVSSNLIRSSNIPVNKGDKITVAMSRRLSADVSGSGFYRDNGMQVRLYGIDGTFWTLQGETSIGDTLLWVESDSDFLTNNKYLWFEGDISRDMTESESLYGSTESPAIPVEGYIQILAHQSHQSGWNRDTYILSVSVELSAFINGGYKKYTGQRQIARQDVATRNIRKDVVYISDSPHPAFKGALKKFNGTGYQLSGRFYNAAQEPDGPVFLKPFGEIQVYDVWNQYNRNMSRFEGTVDHDIPPPSMINRYLVTDTHPNADNRLFLLLHYDYDSHLCEWQAFFMEVSNSVINKQYLGHDFKYLTNTNE